MNTERLSKVSSLQAEAKKKVEKGAFFAFYGTIFALPGASIFVNSITQVTSASDFAHTFFSYRCQLAEATLLFGGFLGRRGVEFLVNGHAELVEANRQHGEIIFEDTKPLKK